MQRDHLRADVELIERHPDGPICYLDNATCTLVPNRVLNRLTEAWRSAGVTPLRANHLLGTTATDWLAEARREIASFINAEPSEIVLTSSATAALNMLGQMLEIGLERRPGEVVVFEGEHYANLLPWTRFAAGGAPPALVPAQSDGEPDLARFVALVPGARLATLSQVSHVTGAVRPVVELTDKVRSAGAIWCVDATQSIGRMPVDVRAIGCDALVFSSQMLLAPAGVGVLYVRRELLDELQPALLGAGSAHRVDAGGTFFTPTDLPLRFEAGSPNLGGAVGLAAGIGLLKKHGMRAVYEQERKLRARLCEALKALPGVRVLGPEDPGAVGIVSLTTQTSRLFPVEHIGVALSDRFRICVRTGTLAATPALHRMGCGEALRVSVAPYTSEAEVDLFVRSLSTVLRGLGG